MRAGTLSPRLQAAAAFSPDGEAWYLINATPDLTTQLLQTPALHPKTVRDTPVAGVILTDGELDHVLGLLHLREGAGWTLFATDSTAQLLGEALPALSILNRYVADTAVETLSLSEPRFFGEGASRVKMQVIETGTELPRYAGASDRAGAVVALLFETAAGRQLAYAPGVSRLTRELFGALQQAEIILFDGTLYSDNELQTLGVGRATAADMGHVPMGGPEGTAVWLAQLPAPVKRYVHLNNTNPALLETSPARAELRELGLELADEPWEVEL